MKGGFDLYWLTAAEPALWGYELEDGVYIPLSEATTGCLPFKLTIIGVNFSKVSAPPELANVVEMTGDITQEEMEVALKEQDVMLLSWNPEFNCEWGCASADDRFNTASVRFARCEYLCDSADGSKHLRAGYPPW